MEEFGEIKDFENYAISNYGKVLNKEKQTFLKPHLDKQGYYNIALSKNGKEKKFSIHRLLALAFIPNPNNLIMVDHMDRNKQNNNLTNLRWITPKNNRRNSNKRQNCSSIYKGVSFHNGKWRSQIKIDTKNIHIGNFDKQNDAANAFNNYIIEHNLLEYYTLNIIV